ncbi:MAG TPA: universal stress protein [Terriglobales bacterium]|nr:universal stress protein [Terriglobales bacterium]
MSLATQTLTTGDSTLKLDSALVATDFSPASHRAVLCATSIARRHAATIFLFHVVASHSERAVIDGWRAGQAEVMGHLLANRLDGVQYELIVRAGGICDALARVMSEKNISLIVLGTRGRTGMRKLILGSVAEKIFRQARCPVITVGPNVPDEAAQADPRRILAATGFAAHSLHAIEYATKFADYLHSSLALVNVVTDPAKSFGEPGVKERNERLKRLGSLILEPTTSKPEFFVEFGTAPEGVLRAAEKWKANLIVLGLHEVEEFKRRETTWANAYEIICNATCPVMTVHGAR